MSLANPTPTFVGAEFANWRQRGELGMRGKLIGRCYFVLRYVVLSLVQVLLRLVLPRFEMQPQVLLRLITYCGIANTSVIK